MSFYTILPVVISAMAVWMDFREASVDNGWILFSFVTGFLIQITERGLKGGAIFLTGVAVPVILLGILFVFRMLGAGDIKLLCALGGIMGPRTVTECIFYSLLVTVQYLLNSYLCFLMLSLIYVRSTVCISWRFRTGMDRLDKLSLLYAEPVLCLRNHPCWFL